MLGPMNQTRGGHFVNSRVFFSTGQKRKWDEARLTQQHILTRQSNIVLDSFDFSKTRNWVLYVKCMFYICHTSQKMFCSLQATSFKLTSANQIQIYKSYFCICYRFVFSTCLKGNSTPKSKILQIKDQRKTNKCDWSHTIMMA